MVALMILVRPGFMLETHKLADGWSRLAGAGRTLFCSCFSFCSRLAPAWLCVTGGSVDSFILKPTLLKKWSKFRVKEQTNFSYLHFEGLTVLHSKDHGFREGYKIGVKFAISYIGPNSILILRAYDRYFQTAL